MPEAPAVEEVLPRLRGRAILIRYADDFVIGFELEEDARRVHAVLPKRFVKYGLTLHPDKTRLLRFGSRSEQNGPRGPSGGVETFDFLGFTHHLGKTKKGTTAVQRRTMRTRFSRSLRAVSIWCRQHRHMKVAEQAQHLAGLASAPTRQGPLGDLSGDRRPGSAGSWAPGTRRDGRGSRER